MKYKPGVSIQGIHHMTMYAIEQVEYVGKMYDYEPTITSCNDGTHMKGSLHYVGQAIDVRTKDLNNRVDKVTFHSEISHRLPKDFDVILEDNHIHIEYDPK